MASAAKSAVVSRVSASLLAGMAAVTHAPAPMVLLTGAEAVIRGVNPAFCRLSGKAESQLIGKRWPVFVPRNDLSLALVRRVFRTGKAEVLPAAEKSGRSAFFGSLVAWPILSGDRRGGVMLQVTEAVKLHERTVAMNEALIIGALRQHELTAAAEQLNRRLKMEITERNRAEKRVSRSEALLAALVANAPVGMYVVDARFRLQQVNPRAWPLFAQVRPLLGRDFDEIVRVLWPHRVANEMVRRFRHTLRTGKACHWDNFNERRRDTGRQEVYEWQIQRVVLPAGDFGVLCFFNDITERFLAGQAQRAIDILTASNAKLKKEIVRRQVVECALQASERRARKLLEESESLQKRLRQISHQMVTVQENQRKEISRELHDKISQLLIGINVHLEIFTREAAINPHGIGRMIAPLRRLVVKSVRTVHQFSRELRPAMLDDLGLIPALRAYLEELPKQKGRRIEFTAFAGVEALDNDKRTVLYRVAQEALTNVVRHAKASLVKVSLLKSPGGVRLVVADNGKAFDVERLSSVRWSGRLGLTGMRERVEMAGGRFRVSSTVGTGTTIRAVLPFKS